MIDLHRHHYTINIYLLKYDKHFTRDFRLSPINFEPDYLGND